MKKLLSIILILISIIFPACNSETTKEERPTTITKSEYFKKIDDEIYSISREKISNSINENSYVYNYWLLEEENSLFYTNTIEEEKEEGFEVKQTLFKTDYNNTVDWKYELPTNNSVSDVRFDGEDIYVLYSEVNFLEYINPSYRVMCFDIDGNEKWSKDIQFKHNPSSSVDYCYIEPCADGFLVAFGKGFSYTDETDQPSDDFMLEKNNLYIQKYDLEGNLLWLKTIGTSGNMYKTSVYDVLYLYKIKLYVDDENIYVSYVSYINSPSPTDISELSTKPVRVILELDKEGNIKSSKKIKLSDKCDLDLFYFHDNYFYTLSGRDKLLKLDKELNTIKKTTISKLGYSPCFIPCNSGMYFAEIGETIWKYSYDLEPLEQELSKHFSYNDFSKKYVGTIDGKTLIGEEYY